MSNSIADPNYCSFALGDNNEMQLQSTFFEENSIMNLTQIFDVTYNAQPYRVGELRGEMRKEFVVFNNLSLRFNTKTKTNINTLIRFPISSSISSQSQRSTGELHTGKTWSANAQLLRSLGSGHFNTHTNSGEVMR